MAKSALNSGSKIPQSLKNHTQQLCAHIRSKCVDVMPVSTQRYQNFISDNFKMVIEGTFPLFSRLINPGIFDKLVAQFLNEHNASYPEFHHIATEFVCFMQTHFPASLPLLPLIEYEWLTFSTEISTQGVMGSDVKLAETTKKSELQLFINPTLQYICMPFVITESINYCPVKYGEFYYAVFRNIAHKVITKGLNTMELSFLQQMMQTPHTAYSALTSNYGIELTHTTLDAFQKINLIYVTKGDFNHD